MEPNQFSSHTRSISASRVTTRPALRTSSASRSNSLRESASSSSPSARRAARSTWRSSIEIGASGGLRGGALGAAQHGADAGDHLGAAERLDHVVVGAELEADDAVGLRAAGGQDDDRDARAGADRAADVAPVAVGQVEVEQDQVGLEALGQLERAGRGARDVGLEALAGERLGERLGDRALVLDEQDAGPLGDRHTPCSREARAALPRFNPALDGAWRAVSILLAMKTSRHQIAAGVTVVALGALATVALASGETPKTGPSGRPGRGRHAAGRRGADGDHPRDRAPARQAAPTRARPPAGPADRPARAARRPSRPRAAVAPAPPCRPRTSAAVAAAARRPGFDDHGGRDAEGADDHGDDNGVEHRGRRRRWRRRWPRQRWLTSAPANHVGRLRKGPPRQHARRRGRRAGAAAVVLGSLALFLVLLAALAGRVRAGEDPALGPAAPVADVAQRRVIVRRVILRKVIVTEPAPRPRAARGPPPSAPAVGRIPADPAPVAAAARRARTRTRAPRAPPRRPLPSPRAPRERAELSLDGDGTVRLLAPTGAAGRPSAAGSPALADAADPVRPGQRAERPERGPPRPVVPASPLLRHAVAAALLGARRTGGLADPTLLGALEDAGYATSRVGVEAPLFAPRTRSARHRLAPPTRARGDWRDVHCRPRRRHDRAAARAATRPGRQRQGAGRRLGRPPARSPRPLRRRLRRRRAARRRARRRRPRHGGDAARDRRRGRHLRPRPARLAAARRLLRAHHLIDRATGDPAWTGLIAATALAPTALEAEALAKAALLSGPEGARRVLAAGGGSPSTTPAPPSGWACELG